MFVRNTWYAAGWAGDFAAGTLTPITLLNEPLVLWRRQDGGLAALADRCPHRLAPLSLGQQEGDDLRCMYHGLKFAPDGRCVEIPGQDRIPPKLRAKSYPVVERHSAVWVWMGDPALADEGLIVDFVGFEDPAWAMAPGRMDYAANYTLINDNLLDLSHLPYVHRNSFGGGDAKANQGFSEAKVHTIPLDRGVRVTRWSKNTPSPPFARALAGPLVDLWSSYDFLVPGIFLLYSGFYPPGTLGADNIERPDAEPVHANFTCQAVTPLTDRSTCYFFAYGPWAKASAAAPIFHKMAVTAFDEDRVMIEAQQRVIDASPNDRIMPLGMDTAASLFRSLMDRLMAAEAGSARAAG